MTFRSFVFSNARWLAGGLNLTFFASFGQTFFIALFAGHLRSDFSLSHGQFGSLYMVSTLASAITLVFIGKVVDRYSVRHVSMVVLMALACACVLMASAQNVVMLMVAIYLLRLAGQGMMTHTAVTAMGRWFVAERGRALAVTSAGHQFGESCFPFLVFALLTVLPWRVIWLLCAALLLLLSLPLTLRCFGLDRTPKGFSQARSEAGRQWTRQEAICDVWFWIACVGILAPGFIGTSVWFHQVHLLELKQWDTSVLVKGFVVMSLASVLVSLVSGQLVDRYSAHRLLPYTLLPLSAGCLLLAVASTPHAMLAFMVLMGSCFGMYNAIFGAVWSEAYGTRHLGSIRSVVFAGMVLSSAVGPGLTGLLIDYGFGFESQLTFMALAAFLVSLVQVPVSIRLHSQVIANRAEM